MECTRRCIYIVAIMVALAPLNGCGGADEPAPPTAPTAEPVLGAAPGTTNPDITGNYTATFRISPRCAASGYFPPEAITRVYDATITQIQISPTDSTFQLHLSSPTVSSQQFNCSLIDGSTVVGFFSFQDDASPAARFVIKGNTMAGALSGTTLSGTFSGSWTYFGNGQTGCNRDDNGFSFARK